MRERRPIEQTNNTFLQQKTGATDNTHTCTAIANETQMHQKRTRSMTKDPQKSLLQQKENYTCGK